MSYLDKLQPVAAVAKPKEGGQKTGSNYMSKLQPVSEGTQTTEPDRGFLGNAASAVGNLGVGALKGVGSTVFGIGKLGQTIGKAITPTGVGNAIFGEDLQKPEILNPQGTAQNIGYGGEQIAEFFVPGGLATKGIKAIEGASALEKLAQAGKYGEFASGALKLIGKSAVGAAEAGAVRAAQTGGNPEEVKTAAEMGAAVPFVLGAAGKVFDKVKSGFAAKAASEAEQLNLLKGGDIPPGPDGGGGGGGGAVPDARVATKMLSEEGKVVTDKVAKEAVRQGIPEADVALIKGGSEVDKSKMAKMLDIRQSQLTNKRVIDRATDVVGDTFVENIAKPIEKLNKEAGKQLDMVAQRLAGKKVDPTPAITNFAGNLERAGVMVGKNGNLYFKGSNFEGLKGAQTLIGNVWKRAMRVAQSGDALEMHRAKSYIDEIVNYGKEAEGLSGKAQTVLKQFRHDIDGILDSKFSAYNKVNTKFSDTIQQLNNMGMAIGRKFRLGDTFADTQAGLSMRRILSNTQSRAEILKLLDGMQKVGQKYGVKMNEDIITQANFADLLEKMLGSEAPTSFLGGIERGQQALSAGADIAGGTPSGLIRGTIKAGKYAIDVTRGINQENKINALRALLKASSKKVSNFGIK